MGKIAIVTQDKFIFKGSVKGYIETKMSLPQLLPEEKVWEIVFQDTCFDIVTEKVYDSESDSDKEVEVVKELGFEIRPNKRFSFEQVDAIAKQTGVDKNSFDSDMEYIIEVLKKGLLYITQKECEEGIFEKGVGMYGTPASTWKIVE